jgi:hypothetical protein
MHEESWNPVLGSAGEYEINQVTYGSAYNGWFLVMTATPKEDGMVWIETMFVPLDLANTNTARLTPERSSVSTTRAGWKLVFDGQIKRELESLQRRLDEHEKNDGSLKRLELTHHRIELTSPAEGEDQRSTLAMQAARIELVRMQIAINTMSDAQPFRSSWDSALKRLRKETFCPKLQHDLDSFGSGGVQIERTGPGPADS